MSPLWTRILDAYTIHQRQMKWVILGVCGVSVLGAASFLLWYWTSGGSCPDAETADVQKIAEYIRSDSFLEKSSVERGEYVEKLMGRYKKMSQEDRREAQNTLGSVLQKNRKLEKTVALSFASKQADEYHKLKTPEQKNQFIDRWLTMMEMAHGGHERAKQEYRKRNPISGNHQPTPEQRKKSIARLRNSLPLIMSKTTSEDRAKLAKMARDSAQRMQERYEGN
ncbi:MAG: hypothetical protein JXA11_04455 [Phycisphaerae bacterium]|nr:hypothetical protein [Phycisphaerae bacterium]